MGMVRVWNHSMDGDDIPRDRLIDIAGALYLLLKREKYDKLPITFEEYYNKYYNHEYIYKEPR